MSTQETNITDDIFDLVGNAALFDGVLSRRAMAFVIDVILITILVSIATVVLFIIGILTFGLLWLAIPPAAFLIALTYVAFTTGGPHSATPGMRALGIELRMLNGKKMNKIMAVFHAIAFYFFTTILTPFIVLIGLFTRRQRLLHDFIAGAIVVNREALQEINIPQ